MAVQENAKGRKKKGSGRDRVAMASAVLAVAGLVPAGSALAAADYATDTWYGTNANAFDAWSVAYGYGAQADPVWGTGAKTDTNPYGAVAIGSRANVNGIGSIGMGDSVTVGGFDATTPRTDYSIAIGTKASVTNGADYATVLGTQAKSTADYSMALGALSSTGENATNSVAIGREASVTSSDAVALGSNSVADRANTVSVGSSTSQRQIVNLAKGIADTDAVNVSQLKAAGLNVDTSGNVANSFVAYDDSTKGKITLAGGTAGTTITNVKAGALSASSTDAVNGSQLFATNQNVSSLTTQITNINGKMADAVMYDSSAHDKVTLGGGTAGTTITNVKAGGISAASTDAVNGSQLYGTASSTAAALGGNSSVNADGTIRKPSYNVAGSTYSDVGSALAAVDAKAATGSVDGIKYDTSAHDKVTFSGTNGTTLSNVNAGSADKDAVNVAQLKAAGLNIDTSGNVTNSFVSYDDATKGKITLGGGTAGTTIANVKAGAVNATSKDAVNGSQLYTVANSTAAALGGGSTVNADGSISAPTYSLNEGSTKVHTVGDAISNLDGRVTQNTGDITDIKNTLIDGGVIDGSTGKSLAVVYDNADKDSVTFGGKGATAPVALHNVAAGVADTDAVNMSQLNATNTRIDNINYNMGNIGDAVMYDSSTHDRLTLGGLAGGTTTAPVILTNVADGASKYDAVNFGQLSALQGQVTNLDNRVTVVEGQVINQGGGGSWNNDAGGKKITNVAAGTETTDAVNVGQLNDAVADAHNYTDSRVGDLPDGMTAKDYTDQSMKSMQSQVNSVAKNAYGGIAAATALTMIPDVDQGKTIAVGVGTGNYKGYQAVALGASARITQNLKVKIGAGMAPGNGTTIGAGASYQW
jgi:autotransporter adhesin